jgi:hypothetical protein
MALIETSVENSYIQQIASTYEIIIDEQNDLQHSR